MEQEVVDLTGKQLLCPHCKQYLQEFILTYTGVQAYERVYYTPDPGNPYTFVKVDKHEDPLVDIETVNIERDMSCACEECDHEAPISDFLVPRIEWRNE